MRDLELWRRIGTAAVTPDQLRALGRRPLAGRAAFLGAVVALVDHADPALRAAALQALAGALGVPGLRAIVRCLDDGDPGVRDAALDALRSSARDARFRYSHALFHPSPAIRRAALADLPTGAHEIAVYLRADPACADLAAQIAWPRSGLPLAFDLHATRQLEHRELVALVAVTPADELCTFLAAERRRSEAEVEAYLDDAARSPVRIRAPGCDVLDQIVEAVDATGSYGVVLKQLVEALAPKRQRALTRRATAALVSHLARRAEPALVAVCVALEPRVLEHASFDPGHAAVAARGLVQFHWPIRPPVAHVERILHRPLVRGDLALAAAVTGLLPRARLATLATVLGEAAIVDALRASDHGWDEICRLPAETPAREIGWLARLDSTPERYAALAAIALGIFSGKRLEAFVGQLPRARRAAAFERFASSGAEPDEMALVTVCKVIAGCVDRAGITEIFAAVLATSAGGRGPVVAVALARELSGDALAAAVRPLDDDAAVRLVGQLDGPDPLPRDRELAVATAFADRTHPVVRAWSVRMRDAGPPPPVSLPQVRAVRALTELERARIASGPDSGLADALGPALRAPVTGLVEALSARAATASAVACAALLGCGDPLDEIARQLDRFAGPSPSFDDELDNACVAWNDRATLPPLGHARLYRWEHHTDALTGWIEMMGGPHAALAHASQLPGRLAASTLWRGIAEVVVLARYRTPEWLVRHGTVALAVFVAAQIDREIGRFAARIAVALVESGRVPAVAIMAELLDRAADADAETRDLVARIARLDGIPPPAAIDRSVPERSLLAQIKGNHDLDQLIAWCADPRPAVVEEAVLALILLGEPGQQRLADLLARVAVLPVPVPVLASVALWDSPQALAVARALAATALPPEWQFHLCLGLGDSDGALAAVCAPAPGWFRRGDWDNLTRLAGELTSALACAEAPHHHAYQRAVAILLDHDDPRVADALRRFLEVDADRPVHLRRAAAHRLLDRHRDACGLPLLIEEITEEASGEYGHLLAKLAAPEAAVVAEAVVSAALIGGHAACSEKRMWAIVQHLAHHGAIDAGGRVRIATRVLEEASTQAARHAAAPFASGAASSDDRLTDVAEVFAWGIRRGVELTGRLFRVHMTSSERDLGHTYLDESRIFVSPLPMLRREPHGRDIVEGLVLHELGHHRYHRGELAQKLWNQARAEGLGPLLNLVADEHLERNLRAVDRSFGDRLKRLGAYAFQHAAQEIAVVRLLASLRGSAARALCGTELEVAFDHQAVRLRRGAVITELERAGHPLARFMRAFRMGQGDRHGDPIVAAALDMCARVRAAPDATGSTPLRALDMQGLYDLTRRLAALFGGATALAQVFGGPEDLRPGERDSDVFGAGIDDELLQREVERILDPRRADRRDRTPRSRGRLQINVAPDATFERITRVERIAGDPEVHRRLATSVTRHAARLRAHLDDLGLRYQPVRARIQGRALDRTRLEALVTRRDPRILVARTPVRRTDLFLGTLVDCSGSMQAGDNIDRARRFAVLVAEAVRPLPGVEARFFGFTDSQIYDAGNARDCAVSGLRTSGGNNDAGALWHAAQVALSSRCRAKVLVMISDGLPTDCSVAALRGLVTQLTRRRGIVCAQVAVRELEENCFPHHVVLDDDHIEVAVSRFGRMIGDLARRVLAS